jgi:hypothetical protein
MLQGVPSIVLVVFGILTINRFTFWFPDDFETGNQVDL